MATAFMAADIIRRGRASDAIMGKASVDTTAMAHAALVAEAFMVAEAAFMVAEATVVSAEDAGN